MDAPQTHRFGTVAIIGCGLMGGSVALALRAAQSASHLIGTSRSLESARLALELGVVDRIADSPAEAVAQADVVVLAVPVTATHATLQAIRPTLPPQALVMDVGSTKRDVVAAAEAALGVRRHQFVAAHPIAGKERGGVDQADAQLYHGRTCILTPQAGQGADDPFWSRATAFWQALGSRVVTMTPQDHDETFAAVSHLPHFLAFSYMHALAAQPAASRHLSVAGPGFRDFTRIACSTSAIWRDIFSVNRDEVLKQLTAFESALATFRSALESEEPNGASDLAALVDAASAVRRGWTL